MNDSRSAPERTSGENVRLFVAVDVDPATRAQLGIARRAMEAVVDDAPVPARLTWVKDQLAHVTLRFVGRVASHRVPAIRHALEAVAFAPFEVTWESVGTFGGRRSPRVIWISPTVGAQALCEVAQQVNDCLDPILGSAEARPFAPHLTIARIRDAGKGVDWSRAIAAVHLSPTVSRIEHVTLYQSHLSPKGPTYTALSTHG
jgi:2'-5' RNA ligase